MQHKKIKSHGVWYSGKFSHKGKTAGLHQSKQLLRKDLPDLPVSLP
jgi:hypothetical protein